MSKIFPLALVAFFGLLLSACDAGSQNSGEGKYYTKITDKPGTSKPQVIEFFSYGCTHCFTMERDLYEWKTKSKPQSVEFVQMPVPGNELFMRAFYTAEALGVKDKIHNAIFERIHVRREMLQSKADLQKMFEVAGVSAERFNRAYESQAVDANVEKATAFAKKFQINSYPSFVINQQYRTSGRETETKSRLLKIITELPLQAQGNQ